MTTNLLTPEERKALIDKLVSQDTFEYFNIAIGSDALDAGKIRKNMRQLYNKCDDATLLSIKL
jgi:hypothetical protein